VPSSRSAASRTSSGSSRSVPVTWTSSSPTSALRSTPRGRRPAPAADDDHGAPQPPRRRSRTSGDARRCVRRSPLVASDRGAPSGRGSGGAVERVRVVVEASQHDDLRAQRSPCGLEHRSCTSLDHAATSAAVAPGRVTMKLACSSETSAPRRAGPWRRRRRSAARRSPRRVGEHRAAVGLVERLVLVRRHARISRDLLADRCRGRPARAAASRRRRRRRRAARCGGRPARAVAGHVSRVPLRRRTGRPRRGGRPSRRRARPAFIRTAPPSVPGTARPRRSRQPGVGDPDGEASAAARRRRPHRPRRRSRARGSRARADRDPGPAVVGDQQVRAPPDHAQGSPCSRQTASDRGEVLVALGGDQHARGPPTRSVVSSASGRRDLHHTACVSASRRSVTGVAAGVAHDATPSGPAGPARPG
jgi:hypothetical protein